MSIIGNIMNKFLICLVGLFCISGCEDNDEMKTRMPTINDPVPHVQVIWKQGNIEMDRIDGHVYLVGLIGASHRGGSYGVSSIVHVSDCPCYRKCEVK